MESAFSAISTLKVKKVKSQNLLVPHGNRLLLYIVYNLLSNKKTMDKPYNLEIVVCWK